jgi:uncharacterized SAM-binding protein YcdF (DUF218 family)
MTGTRARKITLLTTFFLVVLVFVGGCRKAGLWLVKEDIPVHADVTVMLMGNIPDRVLQVADLYNRGISGKIWMVEDSFEGYRTLEERGVKVISNCTRARQAMIELGIPKDSIVIIPGDAVSTQMEVVKVSEFLDSKPEINSVLIVSSASHMRRASVIFTYAFRQLEHPVAVYSCPSSYSRFYASRWWKNKEDIQHVVIEYMKLGNFYLFDSKELRK